MKALITGIAGTGKTTILAELQSQGYVVIDLDATGMCRWKDKETGEVTEYGEVGRDYEWLTKHGWYCDIDTLKKLLSCMREDKDVFVAVITENIGEVANEFDRVFILNTDDAVVKDRLNRRTNNHFAKKEEEQDFVLEHSKELLKRVNNQISVDANQTPNEIADNILNSLSKDV